MNSRFWNMARNNMQKICYNQKQSKESIFEFSFETFTRIKLIYKNTIRSRLTDFQQDILYYDSIGKVLSRCVKYHLTNVSDPNFTITANFQCFHSAKTRMQSERMIGCITKASDGQIVRKLGSDAAKIQNVSK